MPQKSTLDYEKRVAEAAQAYNSGQFSSICAAARKFKVDRQTLSNRLDGMPPLTAKIPSNKALNPIQEDILLYWIRFLDNAGFPATKSMVVSYANETRRRASQESVTSHIHTSAFDLVPHLAPIRNLTTANRRTIRS